MNAIEFIEKYGTSEATRVAEAAGTNLTYFKQIARGHRNPSWGLSLRLAAASGGLMGQLELFAANREKARR